MKQRTHDAPPDVARLLEMFFTERLMHQFGASSHTIASYRDTFRLLLRFASARVRKVPSQLAIKDLEAPLIGAFLDHLEKERGVTARSRNVRLAAVHSFFRYVAFEEPKHAHVIQRVLAIPCKRYERRQPDFVTREELQALLRAPNLQTWAGRRNQVFMRVIGQTGLRVSEALRLRCIDVVLGQGAHVRCSGKGRKDRSVPLRKDVVTALGIWLRRERQGASPSDPVFPSARGGFLSRDSVERFLARYAIIAGEKCPTLRRKRVTAHAFRHGNAMELLQRGVALPVVSLWLGHESPATTHSIYVHADPKLKERALAKTVGLNGRMTRFRPGDRLLEFLNHL